MIESNKYIRSIIQFLWQTRTKPDAGILSSYLFLVDVEFRTGKGDRSLSFKFKKLSKEINQKKKILMETNIGLNKTSINQSISRLNKTKVMVMLYAIESFVRPHHPPL